MTDDVWRSADREDDDFGPPLFGEEESTDPDAKREPVRLSFTEDTGALPHWTEPATGEIPRIADVFSDAPRDPTDDLDVWSSFSAQAPVWSDDVVDDSAGVTVGIPTDAPLFDDSQPIARPAEAAFAADDLDTSAVVARPRREPGRITIGTDPTGDAMRRPSTPKKGGRPQREDPSRPIKPRPGTPAGRSSAGTAGIGGRDMPTAIAVGAIMAIVFVLALMYKPLAVLVVVLLVVGFAAIEFFEKVREKGYQPASIVGIVACVAAPLAVYWIGEQALPLVMVFSFIAGCVSFIGAPALSSNPMPNMAITTLGVTWIGLCGSYGALFLHAENRAGGHIGRDTLALLAIGVVVNDVGALLVGSFAGKTPLRGWISPNKSVEGFIGGAVLTVAAMVIVGILKKSETWSSTTHLILLGLVIAILAPLGDLTESMFKRNLDVKDFGHLVRGHGGVLDRFDGFLFALPAVYYLMVVLEPWTKFVGK
jgi:phosphatidate cytidylyltransferase